MTRQEHRAKKGSSNITKALSHELSHAQITGMDGSSPRRKVTVHGRTRPQSLGSRAGCIAISARPEEGVLHRRAQQAVHVTFRGKSRGGLRLQVRLRSHQSHRGWCVDYDLLLMQVSSLSVTSMSQATHWRSNEESSPDAKQYKPA